MILFDIDIRWIYKANQNNSFGFNPLLIKFNPLVNQLRLAVNILNTTK